MFCASPSPKTELNLRWHTTWRPQKRVFPWPSVVNLHRWHSTAPRGSAAASALSALCWRYVVAKVPVHAGATQTHGGGDSGCASTVHVLISCLGPPKVPILRQTRHFPCNRQAQVHFLETIKKRVRVEKILRNSQLFLYRLSVETIDALPL